MNSKTIVDAAVAKKKLFIEMGICDDWELRVCSCLSRGESCALNCRLTGGVAYKSFRESPMFDVKLASVWLGRWASVRSRAEVAACVRFAMAIEEDGMMRASDVAEHPSGKLSIPVRLDNLMVEPPSWILGHIKCSDIGSGSMYNHASPIC